MVSIEFFILINMEDVLTFLENNLKLVVLKSLDGTEVPTPETSFL